MAADDPPSLLSPLTPIVFLARVAARIGLLVPAGKVLGPFAQRLQFLRPTFRGHPLSPRDVIVATYPKSGTNLGLQIGQQIAWRGAAEFAHIHDVVPWPDTPSHRTVRLDASLPESPTGHRIIKTHLTASLTPRHDRPVCIAIIRDPKEVVVSSYYFALGLMDLLHLVTPDQWVEMFLSDALPFGPWASHAAGWWSARTEPGVTILSFRDVVRDKGGAVDRFAAAMGVELQADERAAVVERSGLEWMKAHESRFAPVPLPGVRPKERPKMIRRGKAGASGELLSVAQQRAIDAHALAGLERLDSDFPYRDWFELA